MGQRRFLFRGRDLGYGYNGAGFLCLLAAGRAYDHATSRTGADVECAANGCHALVHADQPQILSLPLLLLQTTPIIRDQQGDGAILFAAQADNRPAGTRILEHVGERFLSDTVERQFYIGGRASFPAASAENLDLELIAAV